MEKIPKSIFKDQSFNINWPHNVIIAYVIAVELDADENSLFTVESVQEEIHQKIGSGINRLNEQKQYAMRKTLDRALREAQKGMIDGFVSDYIVGGYDDEEGEEFGEEYIGIDEIDTIKASLDEWNEKNPPRPATGVTS